ncbi:zinc-binding alcohol dehydrogenase family protein [Pseudomonas sp. OIL-1]|uniref:zinc-binding alcohol dehydrogenase family protein n=1 Tax=Pseudomonas sp. OIL-1 TaxID=2706126 RepID=UPI0013A75792|nr:zinc-binding alcohol dehydrogenase family protein [Pseudomonas sp. OIL-1]QIB52301.1 zinc-binding alcohol dehydrogenase family protein [Pseudomonas sp. OIL-1]
MKAIAHFKCLPVDHPDALVEIDVPEPSPGARDLLVEVKAVSVNPVDTKVRQGYVPHEDESQPRILGWDAAGVVKAVGSDVTSFKPGDKVWYAGSLIRPGSNSELQLVDERIAGFMPESLNFAQAAAMPLTSLTAWELLFDRLGVARDTTDRGQTLLIIGAAGGAGSILTQLARQLTGLTIVGTASRPETQAWVTELGAHHVIDHSKPLSEELKRIGVGEVSYVASLTQTDRHYEQIVESLKPQGRLGLIDDPETLDALPLKRKSLSLHWELMYTRSLYETEDMQAQHNILNEVARQIDAGVLRTTVGENFGRIGAANLLRAHALLESGKAKGKIVLEGF